MDIYPNANYNGTVNLTCDVSDGFYNTSETSSFNLAPVNDAPINNGTVTFPAIDEDSSLTGTRTTLAYTRDPDGDSISISNVRFENNITLGNANINDFVITDNGNNTWTIPLI